MSRLYGPLHRSLQDRFDTRWLADNVETHVVLTEIPQEHKAFIESRDMFCKIGNCPGSISGPCSRPDGQQPLKPAPSLSSSKR